ncbi:hypothetical protein ACFO4N_12110 [Camelliibacillus cellulosilyticus]|uniref:Uncharacterized protein n=1 Tax=Camelliibacillus cellulosilyticus TaxID=2174486 RepID=A0ABV9GRC1_9BACL
MAAERVRKCPRCRSKDHYGGRTGAKVPAVPIKRPLWRPNRCESVHSADQKTTMALEPAQKCPQCRSKDHYGGQIGAKEPAVPIKRPLWRPNRCESAHGADQKTIWKLEPVQKSPRCRSKDHLGGRTGAKEPAVPIKRPLWRPNRPESARGTVQKPHWRL